jgi:hypothetical protein
MPEDDENARQDAKDDEDDEILAIHAIIHRP